MAAALTLWLMFALWVAAPLLGVPRGIARTAAGLLAAELTTLLGWSYGCEFECTPLGEVAGVAARTDIPILTALFVCALLAHRFRGVLS